MRVFVTSLIAIISLALGQPGFAEDLRFHWEDDFSQQEQLRLKNWIERTDRALTSLVGPLPFTRHIFFHRRDNSREPVPWAHTQRGAQQGVHLYVDLSFSQAAFIADWTAPHELSHLVIPYVGERDAWFAEGFASYMQYQVMGAMGVLEEAEISQRYTHRFEKAERNFSMATLPFTEAAPKLRAEGQYPTMYWGGAIYFKQVDRWLRQHANSDLNQVLQDFLACCRRDARKLSALIDVLDKLVEADIFRQHMATYQTQPGFPAYRKPMISAPELGDLNVN